MTDLELRFAGAYAPPPAHSLPLRFGGGGPATPVGIGSSVASRWRGAGQMQSAGGAHHVAAWGRAAVMRAAPHRTTWHRADLVVAGVLCPWRITDPTRISIAAAWMSGLPAGGGALVTIATWATPGVLWSSVAASAGSGAPADGSAVAPWSYGAAATSYGGPWDPDVTPPTPPPPCYIPPDAWLLQLRFRDTLDTRLPAMIRFRCRGSGVRSVPILAVYVVMNDAYLIRVSDSADIPCTEFTLALDIASWAWSFTATIDASARSLVEPSGGDPVELLAHVNGEQIRVMVESIARTRTFGRSAVWIAGRGRTAWLDAPYSPIWVWGNAGQARTAQQLLDSVMPVGWSATWGLTAWLVPADVWSHQGTPISAAQAIVGAAGGYLQPHHSGQVLRALPRYPIKGWEWAGVTPDIDLPADVVQREAIEWVERPRYNRVYVSGQSGGILGRVTRTGSAGDIVAPMITDPLITHADAARQRGIAVLSDTGRQAIESLRLPVLPATGIIVPGVWVRYSDGSSTRIGLARSVSVQTRFPEVWQTITVETHEE